MHLAMPEGLPWEVLCQRAADGDLLNIKVQLRVCP